jgi:hypothetical protein
MIGQLFLRWSEWNGTTKYEVFVSDGRCLQKWEPVPNGQLRRFKDPVKRHVAAIERVKQLALLTDWGLFDQLSHKEQRSLGKQVDLIGKAPLA